MADKQAVTITPDSLSGKSQDKSLSGEGDSPSKELENKVRENLRGEYERKLSDQTQTLKEQLEEVQERYAELEGKFRLTEKEKAEKLALAKQGDNIEMLLVQLENDPNLRPYVEKINRSSKSAEEAAVKRAFDQVMGTLMEDFLAEAADTEGMSEKELRKELNKLLNDGRYSNENQFRKAKRVLKDFRSIRAAAKKAEEERKKQEEIDKKSFSEDTGAKIRSTPMGELMKKGDTINAARKLGL